MGSNRLENFIFSLMVCIFMVIGMTGYNAFLSAGLNHNYLSTYLSLRFIILLAIAFAIDWFIVSPIVKTIVKKLTKPSDPFLRKVIMISGLMVLFMCSFMSAIGVTLMHTQGNLFVQYAHMFAFNIIVALPLQFLIVGPIARFLFFKVFPIQHNPIKQSA